MPLAGGYLHQPECAVPGIEPERLPHEQQRCRHDEADADPLVYACHEQDDEHHEHGEQAARKDEKVLAFQPLELHDILPYARALKEERPEDGGGDNQEDASPEPACGSF